MSALTSEVNEENQPDGRCLLGNRVEERATVLLDRSGPKSNINRNGHMGIRTVDVTAKVRGVSACRDAFGAPRSGGVRQKGRRTELLEKDLFKRIRNYRMYPWKRVSNPRQVDAIYFQRKGIILDEQIHAELNPDPPAHEWTSVSKSDYRVEGFKSVHTPLTEENNYTTEQAITFWSDNYQMIQGVTAVATKDSPFKKNATFSTPISEQLDCVDDHTASS